ncbi:hypothetical protein HYALB_00011793 [Hymenoscyphus albidus]|uniref:Uncharacterized protein n=1 Tax=Hymenoscyphus albidus TaxID=595503 RepID=A0A9N9Q886_9HELO|nr:hypothetical protein HYALB_00011793 [Hymenoscyphus albidus]
MPEGSADPTSTTTPVHRSVEPTNPDLLQHQSGPLRSDKLLSIPPPEANKPANNPPPKDAHPINVELHSKYLKTKSNIKGKDGILEWVAGTKGAAALIDEKEEPAKSKCEAVTIRRETANFAR